MDDIIDTDGEYAIAFLNKHRIDVLERELCRGDIDYTLLGQVNWWLSYIADTEISIEEIRGADLVKFRKNRKYNLLISLFDVFEIDKLS